MFDEGENFFRCRVYEKADMDGPGLLRQRECDEKGNAFFVSGQQKKPLIPLLEDSWLLFTVGASGQESR